MFKKALQFVTTFGVLLACYAGYVRLFAIIAAGIGPAQEPGFASKRKESKTQREATEIAAQGFGARHWSTDPELLLRYYNHEHGYWMYAKTYERLNDGKRLRVRPFAMVSKSRDGKTLKTATSDEAIVDLDQPLLNISNKSDKPMKVVHARMEGNVQLRDDKGTPQFPVDDLVIGPMPYVEFDEPTLQIKSVSDVVIQDRDMRITGYDILIQLRPKDPNAPQSTTGNFDAKTIYLRKNVHITINDVGNSGILPGQAGPPQAPGQGPKQQPPEPTPLDLRCAGEMKVELPESKKPAPGDPSAPQPPTMIYFSRDVVVKRGRPSTVPGGPVSPPDQLDCDALRLTMVPKPKPKAEAKPKAPDNSPGAEVTLEPVPAATGAGTEMTLREALATGHAVWLQSPGQGIKARCNELIHRKFDSDRADETYLRGDSKTKLWVEKVETVADGPNKGKPQSVTTIRTIDATIFEDGNGSENATIVARGPGLLETRPTPDKPVERKAIWQDRLVIQTDFDPSNQPTKKVTLTGKPEFIDLAQANLTAEKEIDVWLTPKTKPGAANATGPGAKGEAGKPGSSSTSGLAAGSDTFQIKQLKALGNVHLIAPGKVMNARNELDAVFEAPAETTPVPAPAGKGNPAGAPNPGQPASAPAGGAGKSATPVGTDEKAKPAPEAKPEPDVSVTADRVWAVIRLKPGAAPTTTTTTTTNNNTDSDGSSTLSATSGGEVRQVMLRGGVVFHRDPEPDKSQGTDVTAEALDVFNQGDGKMKFVVQHHLDLKNTPAAELAMTPHARVSTEEMTITGPSIGLDQSTDTAWVVGPGTLTQMAPRGLLNEKGLGESGPNPRDRVKLQGKGKEQGKGKADGVADTTLRPLTISWKSQMTFLGRPKDVELGGQPVALAQFHQGVRAVMDDAQLACQERLDVYMDRQISLSRPKGARKEAVPGEASEPKPQISLIDCFADVVIESRKTAPNTRLLLEKQRIEANRVTYDKLSGNFHVPGAGKVTLWKREEGKGDSLATPGTPTSPNTANRRTIRPTANPTAPPPTRRATAVIGRNGSQTPTPPAGLGLGGAARQKKAPAAPLKITLITFDTEMTGRFVAGQDTDTTETRWASFLGDVQTLHATVANENSPIDFDRPPPDYVFLTSQRLEVSSTPSPEKAGAAKNYLVAMNEAQAKSRSETIKADVITYDSQKTLFYAYAENNRTVTFLQQSNVGQPFSGGAGQSLKYNRATGESEWYNPMGPIEFVQASTGRRPGPPGDAKEKKIRTPRVGPGHRIPVRSHTERKGMSSR